MLTRSRSEPSSPTAERHIQCLQIGMRWLPDTPGSGLDRMFHGLVTNLHSAEVGVHGLVLGSSPSATAETYSIEGTSPRESSLVTRLSEIRRVVRTARQKQHFDLVAAHFPLYAAPVLDLIRDLPLVMHFHGPWAQESKVEGDSFLTVQAKKILERVVYQRADRFIVLSEAFRAILTESYGIPESRIRIVPGGVDVDRFTTGVSQRDARKHLGWPTDRPIVLSVRRLARRMGLENLIDAVEHVRRSVPDVCLYVAGTGPLADDLKSQIEERGLEEHVSLLGFVPDKDLPYAYRAADVSIVPSVALEGFGLITIESLAAGTPVLVTPIGGLPETVRGLSEDLILENTEPNHLSAGLARALTDPSSLPSSETCQAYAQKNFSWTTIAHQTREVYDEMLS